MGENKRFGSGITDPVLHEALLRPVPISLTPLERGADVVPEAPAPVDVDAWVRFPETSVRVHGRAVAWTDKAVWVEFSLRDGTRRRAWVWASAVDRR